MRLARKRLAPLFTGAIGLASLLTLFEVSAPGLSYWALLLALYWLAPAITWSALLGEGARGRAPWMFVPLVLVLGTVLLVTVDAPLRMRFACSRTPQDVVDHSGGERKSPVVTDIFIVSVNEVEGPTLRGRVHLINPDIPFVSLEAGFPLALLVDAWFLLANGYLRNESLWESRGPFSVVRGKEIVTSMRLKDDFQELYDLMHRKRVWGSDAGPAEFYRRAADIMISNDASPIHNVPDWSEVVSFDDPDEPWEPVLRACRDPAGMAEAAAACAEPARPRPAPFSTVRKPTPCLLSVQRLEGAPCSRSLARPQEQG
ncbi:hypothetical protein [Nonomuraea sp. NPDC049695]|uniref:hypothetical protein n=1 Tax=Nonomuraea sp. NPDC049695 TaxID=3154734 RepID=UPI00341C2597